MPRNKIIIINDDLYFFYFLIMSNHIQQSLYTNTWSEEEVTVLPHRSDFPKLEKFSSGLSYKSWQAFASQFFHDTFQNLTVLPWYISESYSSPMIHFRILQFSYDTFQNLTVLPWYISESYSSTMIHFRILQFYHDTFQNLTILP